MFDWFFGKNFENGSLYIALDDVTSMQRACALGVNIFVHPYVETLRQESGLSFNTATHELAMTPFTLCESNNRSISFDNWVGSDAPFLWKDSPYKHFYFDSNLAVGKNQNNLEVPPEFSFVNFFQDQSEILFWRNRFFNNDSELTNQITKVDLQFLSALCADNNIHIKKWFSLHHGPDLSGHRSFYLLNIAGYGNDSHSLREFLSS